jgi:hypothetical protein
MARVRRKLVQVRRLRAQMRRMEAQMVRKGSFLWKSACISRFLIPKVPDKGFAENIPAIHCWELGHVEGKVPQGTTGRFATRRRACPSGCLRQAVLPRSAFRPWRDFVGFSTL